jgi:hypothetical protein
MPARCFALSPVYSIVRIPSCGNGPIDLSYMINSIDYSDNSVSLKPQLSPQGMRLISERHC